MGIQTDHNRSPAAQRAASAIRTADSMLLTPPHPGATLTGGEIARRVLDHGIALKIGDAEALVSEVYHNHPALRRVADRSAADRAGAVACALNADGATGHRTWTPVLALDLSGHPVAGGAVGLDPTGSTAPVLVIEGLPTTGELVFDAMPEVPWAAHVAPGGFRLVPELIDHIIHACQQEGAENHV